MGSGSANLGFDSKLDLGFEVGFGVVRLIVVVVLAMVGRGGGWGSGSAGQLD